MIEYYLVFKPSKMRVFKWILKKNFGHVLVLAKDEFNWLVLDPALDGFYVNILPVSADENLAKLVSEQENVSILKLKTMHIKKKYNFLWFMMCSGFVQYYLNLRLITFTPYQLYKKLLKKDLAEVIYGSS